ncbi:hypothetical protein [Rhodanobacter sp. FW106-PBR-R2A-1-13]|uniref:hypothetical protein n=1 Tax=Rhodanobacter sp. FW106-PBR-R2A-1-13 TaxID=3454845 RepID=UPI0034E3E6CD
MSTTTNLTETSANQAPAPVRKMCPHCGSDDVIHTGTMVWDIASQDWMVSGLYDKGAACNACDRENIELVDETAGVDAASPAGAPQDRPVSPTTDPLTIAYIALGAATALTAHRAKGGELIGGGELELIAELIRHAPMLDRLAEGKDFDGVYYYEVAEPFGKQVAERMVDGDYLSPQEAEAVASELIAGATV